MTFDHSAMVQEVTLNNLFCYFVFLHNYCHVYFFMYSHLFVYMFSSQMHCGTVMYVRTLWIDRLFILYLFFYTDLTCATLFLECLCRKCLIMIQIAQSQCQNFMRRKTCICNRLSWEKQHQWSYHDFTLLLCPGTYYHSYHPSMSLTTKVTITVFPVQTSIQ